MNAIERHSPLMHVTKYCGSDLERLRACARSSRLPRRASRFAETWIGQANWALGLPTRSLPAKRRDFIGRTSPGGQNFIAINGI